jgi:hypothetical protein
VIIGAGLRDCRSRKAADGPSIPTGFCCSGIDGSLGAYRSFFELAMMLPCEESLASDFALFERGAGVRIIDILKGVEI